MSHRGLTLLEVLIVLCLLIATAGLVFPAMDRVFRRAEFEETAERLQSLLSMARAESQLRKQPLEVLWNPAERRIEVLRFNLDDLGSVATWNEGESASYGEAYAPSTGPDQESPDQPASSGDSAAFGPGASDQRILTGRSWSRLVLPPRFGILLPGDEPDGWAADSELWGGEDAEDWVPPTDSESDSLLDAFGAEAEPRRLVVYLPDGSALLAESFTLHDGRTRRTTFTINPWTGLIDLNGARFGDSDTDRDDLMEEDDLTGEDDLDFGDPLEGGGGEFSSPHERPDFGSPLGGER